MSQKRAAKVARRAKRKRQQPIKGTEVYGISEKGFELCKKMALRKLQLGRHLTPAERAEYFDGDQGQADVFYALTFRQWFKNPDLVLG